MKRWLYLHLTFEGRAERKAAREYWRIQEEGKRWMREHGVRPTLSDGESPGQPRRTAMHFRKNAEGRWEPQSHDGDAPGAAPVNYEWHNVWYENMKEAPAQPEG